MNPSAAAKARQKALAYAVRAGGTSWRKRRVRKKMATAYTVAAERWMVMIRAIEKYPTMEAPG